MPTRPDIPERQGPGAIAAIVATIVGLCLIVWPAGCGKAAGVLFDPANTVHRWPQPPDEPRIEFVGELRTSADLKPAQGPGKNLGEFLFGKEAPQDMLSPLGVCTDGDGRVFVADSSGKVVHVFGLENRKYERWLPPKGKPAFVQPVAVAWDPGFPGGRLLVCDSAAAAVVVLDGQGRYVGTFGGGLLKRPCGLAVHPTDHRLFVVDAGLHQVVVFTTDGQEQMRIGERGSGLGEFNFPTNAAFDASGRLFVSDTLNFRVQVFGADLRPRYQIGRKGDMPGYFSQPKGLAVDPEGRLYVVDANFEAIQIFDVEGALLMSLGREGRGPGEFWLPAGLATDPAGRIWVADSYNRRVQVFRPITQGESK